MIDADNILPWIPTLITIALIFIGWGKFANKVDNIFAEVREGRKDTENIKTTLANLSITVARLEERTKSQSFAIQEMKKKLEG